MLKNNILLAILEISYQLGIPAVIIGGLALPAYDVARTTIDIDISINFRSQDELDHFLEVLKERGIFTNQKPIINHDLFIVHGMNSEAEIWLKPCDAFEWDDEMVDKIQKFFENINVLSIEDYILTKLARGDRSSIDVSDILKILIANKDDIDWNYLKYRLNWIGLLNDFKDIIKAFELDMDEDIERISKEILEHFNNSLKD